MQYFQGHKKTKEGDRYEQVAQRDEKNLKIESLNSRQEPVGGRRQKVVNKAELSFLK